MIRMFVVTCRARARCVVVRRVAGGAAGVRSVGEHRLITVACAARGNLGLAEAMRLVTLRALDVTGGDRAIGDVHRARSRLLGVTPNASAIRRELGLVHGVAVDAAARAGMLGLALGVTIRARARRERWCRVRSVAISALLIRMRADGMDRALRLVVAAHARRRRAALGAERMTVLACGRRDAWMQRRELRSVTAHADICRWWREAAVAVTVGARDLADVRGMAGAPAHRAIGGGYLIDRIATLAGAACAEADADADERDAHDEPHDGRAHQRGSPLPSG
jgi:hypothetical protein